MAALATVAELEVRLGVATGSLTGTDLARAEAALEDVSALVRDEAGVSFDDDFGDPDPPDSVRTLVLAVAKRVYVNPDGFSSESIGGAYSYSYADAPGLMLTDAERRTLRRAAAAAGGTGGLVSVKTPSAYGERSYMPPGEGGWLNGGPYS